MRFLLALIANGCGHIINIAFDAGHTGSAILATCSGTKDAFIAF
ncbi:MAG: hypothetical protein AB9Q22_02700 [Candidatus Reddybacter sp.]